MSVTLRENVFADEHQRVEAGRLVERLEASMSTADAEVALPNDLHLSRDFSQFLATVLQQVAAGGTVVVGSLPEELTTSVAAEQLGVSRTTLMKHIRSGRLPSHKVGTHTRVKTRDLQVFRRELITGQRKALEELLALEDELGLQ